MTINKIIKISVSIIFLFYLKSRAFFFKARQQRNLIILYYHSINNDKKEEFEKQIRYLTDNFNIVNGSMSNVQLNCTNILITFDDALISVKTNGLSVLKKYKVPSIIFVPTGLLGKEPSWDVYGEELNKDDRIMSDQELLNIIEDFDVILGSHTHTHKDLKKVSESIMIQELELSKKTLETVCKTEANNFSFPYGSYDANTIEKISGIGFKRIFTSKPEIVNFDESKNTFGRVSVNPEDYFIEFWLKVNGAYSWIPAASKLKRRLKKI